MSMYTSIPLGNLTGTATGTAKDVSNIEALGLSVTGTFVGTAKLMISFDNVEYQQFGSDITAPVVIFPIPRCQKARVDCTAYTSGSIKPRLGGGDVNR